MRRILFLLVMFFCTLDCSSQSRALVFQSDFGLKDGAVAAMKGVAYTVSQDLQLFDLTHEIPAYNIWEAAYRLQQAASYWPTGTVFVSVVDPGVGSERRSIVMKTVTGHYFVTPDNGTLTLVAETMGVAEVREIDETKNRLRNSEQSYTFHGRDVYAYTGARLAAGIIGFAETGPVLSSNIVMLQYQKPVFENGAIHGTIDILDVQYGNIWTNIDRTLFDQLNIKAGDLITLTITHQGKKHMEQTVRHGKTFADVAVGQPVSYFNSLHRFSVGLNQGNFAERFKIGSGAAWNIMITKKGR
jgi:S-adenosylmethionine hydrolase